MKKVRGVWLTNVASDVYNSKANIDSAIELLAKTGFNVVFPVVWNKGFTLYKSEVMRRHFGDDFIIDPAYQATGRDPLAELVEASKKFKLKVIPWFEYGFASSHISLSDANTIELRKILKQKNWAAVKHDKTTPLIDNDFEWMNALNPEVQAFMIELIVEVAHNYDIDGIQGDDRLPAFPVEGFDQDAAKRFRPSGPEPIATDPDWMRFRADILTKFLGELCNQVRAVGTSKGKKLLISMAPHPRDFGFRKYLQDTKAWLNLVDMMHPQLYQRTFTAYKASVDQEVSGLLPNQIAKISPGVLMRIGDFTIDKKYLSDAVTLNRNTSFSGEVFFFYEGLTKPDDLRATTLRDSLYSVIKLADEGPDVFKVQKLLKDLGKPKFDPGDVDGIFGTKTETAVKNFQTDQSLTVDGKVGANTLKKLGVLSLAQFGSLPIA
ncbi:family 10 glycosylhydrolase [Leptolyngbya sp. GB1-A1]|uniref:family 10 glycosylhydrolase n=1 Tax=Leptolyngbya sp. GB1-A1 TaxID=2933908 RepID=UPI00329686AB